MADDRTMDNPDGLVAFWLLPQPADSRRLAGIIEQLAVRLGAPPFAPHLTLHSTQLDPDEAPAALLADVCARFGPVRGIAGATRHSPELFRSLFVPVAGAELYGVHQALRDGCRHDGHGFRFEPHVSLLYKVLPEDDRIHLAAEQSLAGAVLAFDRIAAVMPAPGARDFSDIAGWRVVAERPLAGPDSAGMSSGGLPPARV